MQERQQPTRAITAARRGGPSGVRRHDGRRPAPSRSSEHSYGQARAAFRAPRSDYPPVGTAARTADRSRSYPTVGTESVAQGRGLHHAPPRRPAGEPDAPVRSRLRAGPGVLRLPVRLQAVVRREPRSDTPPGGTPRRSSVPTRGHWFSYDDDAGRSARTRPRTPGSACSTAPGMSTGQVGDDIGVATENCANINNNSCQQRSTATTTATTTASRATRPAGSQLRRRLAATRAS